MTVHADVLKKKLHCRFKHSPVYSCSISFSYIYVLDRYNFDFESLRSITILPVHLYFR